MTKFEIESGIPAPVGKKGYADALRKLADSKIGDSLFLADVKVATAVGNARRVSSKKWATARSVEGGVRVWKIAEPEQD